MKAQVKNDYFIAGPVSVLNPVGINIDTLQLSNVMVDRNLYLVARGNEVEIKNIASKISCVDPTAVCCLMDRVYLVQQPGGLWAAGHAFFETAAQEYETMISKNQNAACASYLLQSALRLRGYDQPARILDFGCGTGISSTIMQTEGVEVVSYDCSTAMRDNARRIGLYVINALSDCDSNSIDAVIACYVMHFGVSKDDVTELSRILPLGGLLVANFHKKLGIASTFDLLKRVGFCAVDDSTSFDACGQTAIFRLDHKWVL